MTDIREADIQSYIDRQADRESWIRVEEFLDDRPDEAARVREAREDTLRLRRYFNALEGQIPDRHIADTARLIVEHAPRRRLTQVPAALRIAAMFAFLLVGSATVLGIKLSMTVPAYADAAALAYQDIAREPGREEDDVGPLLSGARDTRPGRGRRASGQEVTTFRWIRSD